MNHTINEKWIRLGGKVAVPFNIEEGDDVVVTFSLHDQTHQTIFNSVKEEFPFNQDGTRDKVSVLKSLTE